MACDIRLLGALVLSPYRAKLKPPLEVVVMTRRIGISANRVIRECDAVYENVCEQLDFFSDISEQEKNHEREERDEQRERSMQQAILKMKKKYGKNAVMRGMNYQEGATAIERNGQVGGHKA